MQTTMPTTPPTFVLRQMRRTMPSVCKLPRQSSCRSQLRRFMPTQVPTQFCAGLRVDASPLASTRRLHPPKIRRIATECPLISRRNFRATSGGMSGEIFAQLLMKNPGIVPANTWQFTGNLRAMSGQNPTIARRLSGNVRDAAGRMPSCVRETAGQCPGVDRASDRTMATNFPCPRFVPVRIRVLASVSPRPDRDRDLSVATSSPRPRKVRIRSQSIAATSPRPRYIHGKSRYWHGDFRQLSALARAGD
jgi:hypothetical protein